MAKTWERKRRGISYVERNDKFARSDAIAARRVLRDCHFALKELLSAEPGAAWRLRWVTIVSLLRAVGHVLDKIDGKRSPHLRAAVKEVWAEIKSKKDKNFIFFEFIDAQRNSILKEYKITNNLVRRFGEENAPFSIKNEILIGDAVLEQADVIRRAMQWWEAVLEDVESRADTLLKLSVQKSQPAPKVQKASKPHRARRISLSVRVEDIDPHLGHVLTNWRSHPRIAPGIEFALQDIDHRNTDAGRRSELIIHISKTVSLRAAGESIANWIEKNLFPYARTIFVTHTMLKPTSRGLRKLIVAKIARRRMTV